MRIAKIGAAVAAFALAATVLSSCTFNAGCSSGEDDPIAAAQSLVAALETASEPADICQWVAPGWTVTASDVDALQSEFESVDVTQLDYSLGEQMGTDVPVTATSADGDFTHKFYLTSDSDYRWTVVNIGTLDE